MAEEALPAALDRIERAIARIEVAATANAAANGALARRHAVLRKRVGDAISALDALAGQE